ncbi:hypothetical protein M2406_003035 [Serratia sp. BIGb0163]|nr:hypothetical protein [Serratia sp. BIGb0163]
MKKTIDLLITRTGRVRGGGGRRWGATVYVVAGLLADPTYAIAGYGGGGEVDANLVVGGMTATPTIEVSGNNGMHPDTAAGTIVFSLTTMDGGTRQGVRVSSVCPAQSCAVPASWSVTLSAPGASTTEDGFTYAETGPTTYKALLEAHDPIAPGSYTVKIETLWIY